jgi:hypothetical protein
MGRLKATHYHIVMMDRIPPKARLEIKGILAFNCDFWRQ